MNFTVTISTYQHAFLDFLPNLFPGTGEATFRETELFLVWVLVMEIKSVCALFVSANHALTTEIFSSHATKLLTSLPHGSNHIFSAVGIGSGVWHNTVYYTVPKSHSRPLYH